MIEIMAKYGYAGLFFGVLADQLGLPVPSMLLVMAAGSLAGLGELNFAFVLFLVVTASMIGDFAWFEIGRRRGLGVLGFLCRFSLESDSCVRDTQNKFVRRGANTLLFAKFFPGLSTIAPPLAGIVGIKTPRFLFYNLIGTLLWAATFLGIGYFFSGQFEMITDYISQFGSGFLILIVAALIVFVAFKYFIRRRFLKRLMVARITADELKQKIDTGEDLLIADLRHELDFNSDPRIIPGAIRISMEEIETRRHELPRDREIILYCTCPNEATSASVAVKLHRHGIKQIRPLFGGFAAWIELGFPVTNYADL